jgi:hypothetical protein
MSFEDEPFSSRTQSLLEEAEALTWSLLDDQLDEVDAARLTALLEKSEAARARYVECVQLHVDLQNHFAASDEVAPETSPSVVVLPNLLPGGLPGIQSRPTVSE